MTRLAEPAPRVTVLMPVHDGARFVRAAVESVLAQTFGDFELLVVDDASTDETPAILGSYDDPRIRIVRNARNLGLTPSLNRGVREARGAYLARLDADDVAEPARLERQAAALDRTPDLALVGSSHTKIDAEGRGAVVRDAPTTSLEIRWRLLFVNAFAHSSVTMRRAVAERAGGYDERYRYAQDYDLWSRLSRENAVAALPEPLTRYRSSSSSMTATFEGSGDEIDEISRRNIEAVLAPAGGESSVVAVDRHAAWPLLFGDHRTLEPRRALAAARAIVALQAPFADFYALGPGERTGHRAALERRLGRRLLALAVPARDRFVAAHGARLLTAGAAAAALARSRG